MDVRTALRNARALLHVHGLDAQGWTVALDNGKHRAGACHYGKRVITLSRYLTEMHSEAEVANTVFHEVAHAMTPGHHHDAVWAATCRRLGGDGKRTHSAEVVKGRYEGTCPACGRKSYRHRMSKAIKLGASCGKCNPHKFDARFRLSWVDRGLQMR